MYSVLHRAIPKVSVSQIYQKKFCPVQAPSKVQQVLEVGYTAGAVPLIQSALGASLRSHSEEGSTMVGLSACLPCYTILGENCIS